MTEHNRVELPEFDSVERRAGLLTGRVGHLAVVLFDRPDQGNAFHREMREALGPLLVGFDEDPEIRVIVLGSTTTRFFSTGIDLSEVAGAGDIGADLPLRRASRLTNRHNDVFTPVVCAVEGRTIGGGLHFVVDADIVVAAESATFADSHVNVGFVGALENLGLALKAGIGSALYLTLVGRAVRMDARRGYELGLVQEIVPDGTALARGMELAQLIAANSPAAVRASLESIWALATMGYPAALDHGWSLVRRHWGHPDSTEGPKAFAEGRAPQWVVGPA